MKQAEGAKGAILELTAGTGRVSVPLAQAGHRIVGLDSSRGMLEKFREKQGTLHPIQQRNVCLVQGDMRNFSFKKRFDLILIPYNAFIHLLTREDQLSVLRNLRNHLSSGGKGIIDLFSFDPAKATIHYAYDHSTENPVAEETLHRYSMVDLDMSHQQAQVTHFYDIIGSNGKISRRTIHQTIRYVFRFEMELLPEKAGLRLKMIYGDYEAGPYEKDSPQMIFLVEL